MCPFYPGWDQRGTEVKPPASIDLSCWKKEYEALFSSLLGTGLRLLSKITAFASSMTVLFVKVFPTKLNNNTGQLGHLMAQ